jgi:hypothetical protein
MSTLAFKNLRKESKRKVQWLLIMSLIVMLSSSSFLLCNYLTQQIIKGKYSKAQLNYAVSLKVIPALKIKQRLALKGSSLWLNYTTKLALQQPLHSLILAKYYQQQYTRNQDKVLLNNIVFWHKKAIKQGSMTAVLSLAKWFYHQNELPKAEKLLAAHKNYSTEYAILYFKILIAQGTIENNAALTETLQKILQKTSYGQAFLQQLTAYQIIKAPKNIFDSKVYLNASIKDSDATIKFCDNTIQFFATRLVDLIKVEQLIKGFKNHALAAFVCFAPVRYIAATKLSCKAVNNKAIRCDESIWRDYSSTIKSKYIGLLLPSGGANVHLGMVYLDSQDTVQVFAHEISHLLGFIDEYSLPLQHPVCQQKQKAPFAHNIAVIKARYHGTRSEIRKHVLAQIPWSTYIKPSTPILQARHVKNQQVWQVGTPNEYNQDVGVFLAETCHGRTVSAFKALAKQTQLRYYEEEFPKLYIQQFKLRPQQFLMPSFHYNLALTP